MKKLTLIILIFILNTFIKSANYFGDINMNLTGSDDSTIKATGLIINSDNDNKMLRFKQLINEANSTNDAFEKQIKIAQAYLFRMEFENNTTNKFNFKLALKKAEKLINEDPELKQIREEACNELKNAFETAQGQKHSEQQFMQDQQRQFTERFEQRSSARATSRAKMDADKETSRRKREELRQREYNLEMQQRDAEMKVKEDINTDYNSILENIRQMPEGFEKSMSFVELYLNKCGGLSAMEAVSDGEFIHVNDSENVEYFLHKAQEFIKSEPNDQKKKEMMIRYDSAVAKFSTKSNPGVAKLFEINIQ